jgi:nucleoside-diphosphate-sugar epimerase
MNISKKNILIAGGGGFIGGHLADKLLKFNNNLIIADIKPKKNWFQYFDKAKNYVVDLKDYKSALKVTKNVDYVFNMACNMGGMGFIENNKAECMLSVLINTNLLRASLVNKVKKFFFSSSACAYNVSKQNKTFIKGLKEEDAYPADPEDGMDGKNYLVKECVDILPRTSVYKQELLDIIMFMARSVHLMEVEKKLLLRYVEKLQIVF